MSMEDIDVQDSRAGGDEITENDIGGAEELMAAIDATIKPFDEGDLVTGTVVKIDPEEVLLDIGYKSEGVIPARELSIRNDVNPSSEVTLGDTLECLVLQMEDKEGRLILSKKRASYERAWADVEEKKNRAEPVLGRVIEVVKGGLIVDIGLRGFLPASLVELRRVKDLDQYVGQEITCKIIELDRNRNNVVLSRRAFLEEESSEQRKEFLDNLRPGERRKGKVSSIVNFGAFVDLGGVDGLVHVSELSWKHVEHPSEVVKVGDELDVEVLEVDMERERVSLSFKKTQEDPWARFARMNALGDVVQGKVTKTVPFGAFVEVAEGIEGLVHVSEIAEEHVEMPDQVLSEGEMVNARIIDMDAERRRISLSIKQASASAVAVEYSTSTEEIAKEEAEPAGEPASESVPAVSSAAEGLSEEAAASLERATESPEQAPAEVPPAAPEDAEEEAEEEAEPGSLEAIVEEMKKDLSS